MAGWLNSEVSRLRALYPSAAWTEIEAALPRHNRSEISHYAGSLHLRRVRVVAPRLEGDPIVQQLRLARIEAGLSITELAKRSDVDRTQIHAIERKGCATVATIRKLCAGLNLKLVVLPKGAIQ